MHDAVRRVLDDPCPNTLRRLRRRLDDEHLNVCGLGLVEELAKAGDAAHELLAAMVEDEAWAFVRCQCIRRLGELRHPSLLRLAVDLVDDEEAVVRSVLAEALAHGANRAAIPFLERLLRDDEEWASMWVYGRVMDGAARGLARIHRPPRSLHRWIEARLTELDTHARGLAAVSLGHVKHPAALEPLLASGLDDDKWAIELLAEYRSDAACGLLCGALQTAPDSVRCSIAYALGKNGYTSSIPTLGRALENGTPPLRFAAARGLRWLEDETADAVLAGYRDDPDPDIRSEVRLAFDGSPHPTTQAR